MPTYLYWIIAIVLFVVYLWINLYFKHRTRKNTARLTEALMKPDFKKFDALMADPVVKKSVSPYERYLLQFNSYLMRKEPAKINQAFAAMNDLNLNSRQKMNFYGAALSYYAEAHDQKRATIAHNKILTVHRNTPEKFYFDEFYQVMIQNKVSLLPVIERRVKKEPDQRKASDYYLLAHLYGVKGEQAKAHAIEKKADQLVKQLQQEQRKAAKQ